jgi:Fur family ferric uptake transcriptional regulator
LRNEAMTHVGPAREAGDARERLRQAGLQVTTPRRVVLEQLADYPHVSIAEVGNLVRCALRSRRRAPQFS